MKQKRIVRAAIAALLVVLVLLAAALFYLTSAYPAETDAMAILEQENVSVQGNMTVFTPEQEASAGLIFYPGGNVAAEAYAPLLQELADRGVLCVLVRMPYDLAVLAPNRANGVQEQFPQITRWYMGGHSLGGAMAASFVSKHAEDFEGLVLLAAYSTADLSESGLKTLRIYGTEDGVMNRKSYEKYEENLPADGQEVIIDGGCHAYFGAYGAQSGDGIPTVSPREQRSQTVAAILTLMETE